MHMTVSAPVREQIKVYMTTYRFLTASRKEKRANTTPALTGVVEGHGMQAIGVEQPIGGDIVARAGEPLDEVARRRVPNALNV